MSTIVEFETIPELFNRVVDHFDGEGRPALRYKDRSTKEWVAISWEEYREQVRALAAHLYERGVRAGDRVAILSENRPEWMFTDLATQLLGAVNVSLYTSLPASQVAFIVRDSGSKVLVTSTSLQLRKAEQIFDDCPELEEVITMSELRSEHPPYVKEWDDVIQAGRKLWPKHQDAIEKASAAVKPDDTCALIYTSGTTGRPKGVMLTHHNFVSNTRSALGLFDFGPTDHHLSFLPLCHSFERTAGYTAMMASGALVTFAESIDTVAANLVEVSPTVMISVPRLFERVYGTIIRSVEDGSPTKRKIFNWAVSTGRKAAEARKNGGMNPFLKGQFNLAHRLVFSKLHERLGGNLRFAVSGGAALPREIGEFFEAAGITIVEGYGLTETAPVVAANPLERPRYGTVGHVLPGVTVAIQSLTDKSIIAQLSGDDYPSELGSSDGEILVKGPNVMKGYWQNEDATRESIDADGWYHTGDVGRFDGGYLMITDRIKHMIVSRGGKNIYPGPIEDSLKSFRHIDQIVILGEGREYLTALVVPNFDSLTAWAKEKGISFSDEAELIADEAVRDLFEKEFRSYSRNAAAHEKVRGFRLIREAFTIDNEMLTPTMKPRRRAIEAHYAELIEEMYNERSR